MSRRESIASSRLVRRLKGLLVLGTCAGLSLPLLVASGGAASRVDDVLSAARAQVGDAYVWGGNGPDGWDCSGLTSWAWREAGGVSGIPRTSGQQQRWAVPIPKEQLLPGDLVFFGDPVYHVALYQGGGRIVDASSARTGVVERALWRAKDARYGRVPRSGMPAVTPWTPPPPPSSAAPDPNIGSATAARPSGTQAAGARAEPAARQVVPLTGLPAVQRRPSTPLALRAVGNARSVRGSRRFTDHGLVREAWRHARGGTLPAGRDPLVARGGRVATADLRVGDLVVYGSPKARQLSYYVGHGYMVGVATSGTVAVRRVYASPTVRFVRLPAQPSR